MCRVLNSERGVQKGRITGEGHVAKNVEGDTASRLKEGKRVCGSCDLRAVETLYPSRTITLDSATVHNYRDT